MTSKQRAYLKSLAMKMDPIMQLGKGSVTPENTASVDEALAARELIKISVLQNCLDDPRQMAEVLAERTHSEVVQVIGRKIVLYLRGKERSFFTAKVKKTKRKSFFHKPAYIVPNIFRKEVKPAWIPDEKKSGSWAELLIRSI